MKIKLGAVIPTVQYGNLQPEFEVEFDENKIDPNDTLLGLEKKMQEVWNKYAEKPLLDKVLIKDGAKGVTRTTKRLKDFFGNSVDYDEVNHVYSWNGEIYESGSQYAAKFDKPFDKEAIAGKMAAKYGVKAQEIIDMWELNARTSREFGTALHSALELYGVHKDLATALERDSALHAHPVIRQAVQSFYEGREDEKAHYEVLIIDHKNKRAGRIDRMLENGPNDYTVQDYKTNGELKPDKLRVYWKQLEFYTGILEANHVRTRPPQIFHYNGSWKTYNKGLKETV